VAELPSLSAVVVAATGGGGIEKVVVARVIDDVEKLPNASKAVTLYEYVVLAIKPLSE
jgi:hypothetical protein